MSKAVTDDDITRWALAGRDGDRAALERFVTVTQDDVWRLCAHLVTPAAADDIRQEAYMRAIKSLPGFRGDAPARLWLLSIARRTAMDALRRKYRDERVVDAVRAEPPATSEDLSTSVHLAELIAGLDPHQREAFVSTQVLGLSYEEAAEVCGCPIGTIRSRVARARQALVSVINEPDEDHRGDGNSADGSDDPGGYEP